MKNKLQALVFFMGSTAFLCFMPLRVWAQNVDDAQVPTEIFAEGKTSPTQTTEFFVEQPADASNPLGNPIVAPDNAPQPMMPQPMPVLPAEKPQSQPMPAINQTSGLGTLQPGQVPLPQGSNQIENEMYESGNDIVDVQEYPIDDVNQMSRQIDPATLVNQPQP